MANWADTPLIGLPETLAKLDVKEVEIGAKAVAGLHEGADLIVAAAKANLSGHRWTGRIEDKISVQSRGPLLLIVRSATPGGSALEYGWSSRAGLQPPSGPRSRLVKWLGAHGATDPKRMAFAVARQIGKQGYTFAPLHWMGNAVRDTEPAFLAAVERSVTL